MMRNLVVIMTVLAGAAATPSPGHPGSIAGKWRLNPDQSEFLAGEEPPAELIMNVTVEDGVHFRWIATVRMSDGSKGSTGFDGAIDGKPYPISGRPGSTSAFSWMPGGALKQVSQSAAGISVEVCGFSGGAPSTPPLHMTCNVRQTDSQGRAASYAEVFDRV